MPYQIPGGQNDASFIARVRRDIRDQPVWFKDSTTTDGVMGATNVAGSMPFRLKKAPVLTGSVSISLGGAAQQVVYDVAPVAPEVAVITETGEYYWATPPAASQTILLTWQGYRWSDGQVLEALEDGLKEMWPDIWLPASDSSIMFSPMTTEYTLPTQFHDPRVTIISVEAQPPAGILVSVPTGMWRRQALDTLIFQRVWPAGTVMRLTYNSRYVNLSDLEGDLPDLPVYYANYKLLMDQETSRARAGDIQAQTGEGAAGPKQASDIAQLWLTEFLRKRTMRSVAAPYTTMVPGRSVEILDAKRDFEWNPV